MDFNKIDLNKYRTEEVTNIFSNEGAFSDGRPYIEECWAEDGCTMVTLFTPSVGFEIDAKWKKHLHFKKFPNEIKTYLEKEKYNPDFFSKGINLYCFGDEKDRLLSINILVGIND
jgi:hypothetical protein